MNVNEKPNVRRLLWFSAFVLVMAVGVLLRTDQFSAQIISNDEWHALHKAIHAGYSEIATSFGHADHSIPLTLYYRFLYEASGLSENALRMPLLLAGILTILVVPLLLRPFIDRYTALLLAALLSISPFLIHYSRVARPYALTCLLGVVAIVAFYRWWKERRTVWGAIYLGTASLAGYLHPATLAFTLSPFLYYGSFSLYQLLRMRDADAFTRLLILGMALLVVLLLLLGPPIYFDLASITAKSQVHQVTAETFWQGFQLFVGTGNSLVSMVFAAVTSYGIVVLSHRHPQFVGYLAFSNVVYIGVVASSGATYIFHGITFFRYLIPLLPLVLLFFACGCVDLYRRITRSGLHPMAGVVASFFLLAGLFLIGPIPELLQEPNQFTSHMRYQFDYDKERNVYANYGRFQKLKMSDFFTQISESKKGELTIIHAPWSHEFHYNRIDVFQRVHGQHIKMGFVGGICGEKKTSDFSGGEYPAWNTRLRFRHFVLLEESLETGRVDGDFLVFDKVRAWHQRLRADVGKCIRAFKATYPERVYYEDDLVVVFSW